MAVIAGTLDQPRDNIKLRTDAVAMRVRHREGISHRRVRSTSNWSRGGLVDTEFTVHLLQLQHRIAFTPRLRVAAAILAEAGLLDPAMIAAHELLTRMLVTLRLVSPGSGEPPRIIEATDGACMRI